MAISDRAPATADEYAEVTLDITTLTLGEAAKAEAASGQSWQQLMAGSYSRRLLAMFIHELRSSAAPRSWHELSSLRLLDVSSSILRSQQDNPSETSSD